MKMRPARFRRAVDMSMRGFSAFATFVALALMAWILFTIFREGAGAISLELLVNCSKPYGEAQSGIANALIGTALITGGATVLAVPPAMAAGIWLAEFGRDGRFASLVRFVVNALMGVPSVIVGLFVYGILVATTGHFSGLAGSVALAILMFPVIVRTAEDQLSGVPDTMRESGLALGATRTRVTLGLVCRSAKGGLITGILLAIARVSGETAPLLFTALYADAWPTSYFTGPTPSAPVFITNATMDSPFDEMHRMGWGAALVVAAAILALNITVRTIAQRKASGGR